MPIEPLTSILIILVVAVTTFLTRVIPFILFPPGKKIPAVIRYLGKVLPAAVIGMLVIYCFRTVTLFQYSFGAPEVLAGGVVILLHIWKRNNLLSIGSGTVLYMVLIQAVF
jgi:branched-subunit amino acid transport protein AzlD